MEQKSDETPTARDPTAAAVDINATISDYLLKKGYIKTLDTFSEEQRAAPKPAADSPLDSEHASGLLLSVTPLIDG